MELMTAYTMTRAQREYGIASVENIERTATDIATQRTGSAVEQNSLNKDIQSFIADRYRTLDNENDGNWVLRDKAAIQSRVSGAVGNLRGQTVSAANEAKAATSDNRYDDPRPKNINGPTNHAEKAADNRRGAINAVYEDNGAFDFGSNTLKQFGRDLARPMIPQPESPDARSLVGGPNSNITGPVSHTPTSLNTNPPNGTSTLGNGPRNSGGSWNIDPESLKRLEELSQKLEGR
jgi:conjugal transfer mating pair stabilization protein TraG